MTIALAILALAASSPAKAAEDGAALFKSNCVVCHGADGTGTPTGKSLKAPDLHSEAVQKLTDAQIAAQIENGKNNMPPFKGVLNADQIKALVVYVRTFKK
ncbi:MAG: cytochrome c [Candidatus Acidiferrales bacterium]